MVLEAFQSQTFSARGIITFIAFHIFPSFDSALFFLPFTSHISLFSSVSQGVLAERVAEV